VRKRAEISGLPVMERKKRGPVGAELVKGRESTGACWKDERNGGNQTFDVKLGPGWGGSPAAGGGETLS